jgi:hypothetical protein
MMGPVTQGVCGASHRASGRWTASAESRVAFIGLMTAALAVVPAILGCGGGSPSDIVLPEQVDVSFIGLQAPAPRSVGLELAASDGRQVSLGVVALELESASGIAFELLYDAAMLEFAGMAPGTFFGSSAVVGASVVEAAPGRLVGVAASSDQASALNGSGTLLVLSFRLTQLRDAETGFVFAANESLVYGPEGPANGNAFTGGQLVTRISLEP